MENREYERGRRDGLREGFGAAFFVLGLAVMGLEVWYHGWWP